MADGMEPLVRRVRGADRTGTLVVRMRPESIAEIDKLAKKRGWTRADTVRSLLRAGLDMEAKP